MRSSWHFITSGFNVCFPRTPKMKKKLKKCSSDYFHILHIVELWCDFKMFVGPWSIYKYNVLWVLLTNVYWFRATGGYICGCGRPSNLVGFWPQKVYQVSSNIAQNHSSGLLSGHYFPPIHMKNWPKSKLGQVGVGSKIAQNHSSSPQEGISGHYLPQFIWKVP